MVDDDARKPNVVKSAAQPVNTRLGRTRVGGRFARTALDRPDRRIGDDPAIGQKEASQGLSRPRPAKEAVSGHAKAQLFQWRHFILIPSPPQTRHFLGSAVTDMNSDTS